MLSLFTNMIRRKIFFRPKLILGLIVLFMLSACNTQKSTESNDGKKTTKDKASKKNKKDPQVICYCPAF